MKHFSTTAAGALCASLLCSTAGFAEVTAEQVWQDWQAMSERFGYSITGTESASGDTLTVSDVELTAELPEVSLHGTLDSITFRENGDGTVTVTMAPDFTQSFTSAESGEKVDMTMQMHQSGMEMLVDGNENAMSYDVRTDEMTMDIAAVVDGEPADMTMGMVFGGMTGKYLISRGGTGPIAAEGAAETLQVTMKGTDPESGAKIDGTWNLADMTGSALTQMVADADPTDLSAMLQAGFSANGNFAYGASDFSLSVDEKGEQFMASGQSQGGSASFAISKESLNYAASQRGFEITLSGSEIPFPQVTAQLGELDFNITIPASKSDAPQDFAMLTSFKGLNVGTEIWSMFDPAGMIPRDPANLVLDLAGTGNWLVDIMDPASAESLDKQPGELHSLTLKDMELSIAGASLTGTGAFTFDNSDLESFDGMPAPSGQADFTLTGANKLLDTLVNMGLVPEDQAQGMRMMTGMFARPGDGEDTLVSEIVVTEDGQVLANGQRLK